MPELVYNIEPASPTMLAALDRHCRTRSPDGTSAIDPDRSHRNCVFYGSDEGLMQSLREFYEGGVQKPT
ncbi:MAG: phage tail tape measure protein, partial [Pseudomonadota bacterium]